MDPHRLAELRSIALHRAIGDRIIRQPELVDDARRRLHALAAEGKTDAHYRDEWLAVLVEPIPRIVAFLGEDTERARDLRQATPFTAVISPRDRWQIWRSVREGS